MNRSRTVRTVSWLPARARLPSIGEFPDTANSPPTTSRHGLAAFLPSRDAKYSERVPRFTVRRATLQYLSWAVCFWLHSPEVCARARHLVSELEARSPGRS